MAMLRLEWPVARAYHARMASLAQPSIPPATRGGMYPVAVIAGAVALLALPGALLAFASQLDADPARPDAGFGAADLVTAFNAPLLRALAVGPAAGPPLFRFTPAGFATRRNGSLTVTVRVDPVTAHTIIVRAPRPQSLVAVHLATVGQVPGQYVLGVSPGAPPIADPDFVLPRAAGTPAGPGLASFSLSDISARARVGLAPRFEPTDQPHGSHASRPIDTLGEQSADLAGSYRLSRNVNVMAGVRYAQDRDRLPALVQGKQDQAVFVGTQFRF